MSPADVAIASLDLRLCEIEEKNNRLNLLDQMKQEELIKDLSQIFQSCSFNRSVTFSPPAIRQLANIWELTQRRAIFYKRTIFDQNI
jgi:hypothetical protein